jgi:hypothetical protein
VNGQSFSLVPHQPCSTSLLITGNLALGGGVMELEMQLQGDLDAIRIAPTADPAERRDLLWQTTCLEVFLARQEAEPYWEFNLSPSGHWNVYRLEGYRQGLTPEPAYAQLPFSLQRHHQLPGMNQPILNQLNLKLRCPLPPALAAPSPAQLEAAITAVVQLGDDSFSYWALHHPAAAADFHHRGGFRRWPTQA